MPETLARLAELLGVPDLAAAVARAQIKAAPPANADEAIARGVFGVPTFANRDKPFWGNDATPLFAADLADTSLFACEPYAPIERVTYSATRPGAGQPSGA